MKNDWKESLASLDAQSKNTPSEVLLAAAFSVYMGPYDEEFRKKMLTQHWTECLINQGMPVDFLTAHQPNNNESNTLSLGLRQEVIDANDNQITPKGGSDVTQSTSLSIKTVPPPYEDVFYAMAKNLTPERTLRRWLTQGFDWNTIESLVLLNPPLKRAVYCIDPEKRLASLMAEMIEEGQELVELDFSQRYVFYNMLLLFLFRDTFWVSQGLKGSFHQQKHQVSKRSTLS